MTILFKRIIIVVVVVIVLVILQNLATYTSDLRFFPPLRKILSWERIPWPRLRGGPERMNMIGSYPRTHAYVLPLREEGNGQWLNTRHHQALCLHPSNKSSDEEMGEMGTSNLISETMKNILETWNNLSRIIHMVCERLAWKPDLAVMTQRECQHYLGPWLSAT